MILKNLEINQRFKAHTKYVANSKIDSSNGFLILVSVNLGQGSVFIPTMLLKIEELIDWIYLDLPNTRDHALFLKEHSLHMGIK